MEVVADRLTPSVKVMPMWDYTLIGGALVTIVIRLRLWRWVRRPWKGVRRYNVPLPDDWTWRPEADRVIDLLTRDDAVDVGLHGPGGFGKTSLARAISGDQRIREHFRGGTEWVRVGQPSVQTDGAELLRSFCASLSMRDGSPPKDLGQMMSVEHLTAYLVELLEKRDRVLVVVDDVWTEGQLEPFLALGEKVWLLVTAQKWKVFPRRKDFVRVQVQVLAADAARTMLSGALPDLSPKILDELLEVTGRWPQLLGLVVRRLATEVGRGAVADKAAKKVIAQFDEAGITAFDVEDSEKRETAIRATIEYSLAVLSEDARSRFLELGIFAPNVDVPLETAAQLWRVTAGLSPAEAERLCDDLAGLSLLALREENDRLVITLNSTIRLFTLSPSVLGPAQRVTLNRSFVDASRGLLVQEGVPDTPWWLLPRDHFLWDQLAYHLAGADWQPELTRVVTNLEWVLARLEQPGPWALESDLGFSTARDAGEIRRLIARVGYLLGDVASGELVRSSRRTHLSALPVFRAQVEETAVAERPDLLQLLPIPESRESDPMRTMPAHHDVVTAVVIMERGRFVTGCRDGTVCMWDIDKGTLIRRFKGHTAAVTGIAVAREGTLLATASEDQTIRLWNWEDGTLQAVCEGHTNTVTAVAIRADGSRIASSSMDGTVRTWDRKGRERGALKVQGGWSTPSRSPRTAPGSRPRPWTGGWDGGTPTACRWWNWPHTSTPRPRSPSLPMGSGSSAGHATPLCASATRRGSRVRGSAGTRE
ncbi:hypothetical protein HerbRD11066_69240 [Herbidospora sp. RD11066]